MSAYRERREARAERLRGWAEVRQQRAAAVFASHEVYRGDVAFNTQPGHIPERARVIAQTDRAVESLRKAERMDERAGNIESQLDHAIYSDDPDAIERLTERIAELEAERERIKTANAAYRKEHGAELRGLSAYQREQKMPHAGWSLTNLSGNIARQRKRLEDLQRRAAIRAKADQAPAEVCDFCKREVHAIGPREWVDNRNNKASAYPEWHEHAPRGPWRAGQYMKISVDVHGLGLDPERREVAQATGRIAKVAMIRRILDVDLAVPPLFLNCPCGANPPTALDGPDVTCTCGATYSYNGWRREA